MYLPSMGSSICRSVEEVEDDEEDAISYFRGAAAAGKNAIAFVAHNRYVIIWSRSTSSVVASPRLQLRWELCPPWVCLHHHHQHHHRHHHHPCDVLSATLSLSCSVSPSPWPIYLAMQEEEEAAAGMGSRSGRMVSVTSSRRNNIDDANAKLFRCIDR